MCRLKFITEPQELQNNKEAYFWWNRFEDPIISPVWFKLSQVC